MAFELGRDVLAAQAPPSQSATSPVPIILVSANDTLLLNLCS